MPKKRGEDGPGIGHNGGPEFTDWSEDDIAGKTEKGQHLDNLFRSSMALLAYGGSAAILGYAVLGAIAAGFGQTAEEFLMDGVNKILEHDPGAFKDMF